MILVMPTSVFVQKMMKHSIRTCFLIRLLSFQPNSIKKLIEPGKYVCWHYNRWGHLTHRGRVMHICISIVTSLVQIIAFSPDWRQAIIWTNAGILLFEPLGTNFSESLIEIQTLSFKKIHFKMSSGKWRPFCLGLNVLRWELANWWIG